MKGFLFLLLSCFSVAHAAPMPIYFWHSMSGPLAQEVNRHVANFNKRQDQYQVIPVYKGTYPETLTSLVAAFRAGQAPHLAQVFEIGTATMTSPKGAIVPLAQLFKDAKLPLDESNIIPSIRYYYADKQHHLLAFPFNVSTAVLYYNVNALQAVHAKPPRTWPEVYATSRKLLDKGYACGFTTSWPSWIQFETFSAIHGLPFATENNGYKGTKSQLLINNAGLKKHLTALADWQKQGVFQYGGRTDNSLSLFTSGHCAMIFQSSGARNGLKLMSDFPVASAGIPYWPSINKKPQNAVLGGAALWVMQGHDKASYRGVAAFLAYLLSDEVQIAWQANTGYLPITLSAFHKSLLAGYYQDNPDALVPIHAIMHEAANNQTAGIRLGYFGRIRDINNDAFESILAGTTPAERALENAVIKANRVLARFHHTRQK